MNGRAGSLTVPFVVSDVPSAFVSEDVNKLAARAAPV